MSISEMLKLLNEHRIEFTQNSEALLEVPVKGLLLKFQKNFNKDLNLKNSLNIIE